MTSLQEDLFIKKCIYHSVVWFPIEIPDHTLQWPLFDNVNFITYLLNLSLYSPILQSVKYFINKDLRFFFLVDLNNSKYQQLLIHHIRCAFQFGELLSEVRFLFIYLLSSTYLLVDKLWPLVKLGEKKIAILFID